MSTRQDKKEKRSVSEKKVVDTQGKRIIGLLRRDEGVATVLAVFYAVGIVGHGPELTSAMMALLTPSVLLVTGLVVAVPFWRQAGTGGRLWLVLTYLVTYLLEVVGVATGDVFGAYEYGAVLGFQLFDVPLIIGFNWVLVILGFLRGGKEITDRFDRLPRIGKLLLETLGPAAAAVLFDYIMEPIAIRLEYWVWDGVEVPLQNYLAWFLIALLASAAFKILRIDFSTRLPLYYTLIQLLFFLGLYLVT